MTTAFDTMWLGRLASLENLTKETHAHHAGEGKGGTKEKKADAGFSKEKAHAALRDVVERMKSHSMGGSHLQTDRVQQEDNGEHSTGVRDFGRWENPPEARHEEDYDHQRPTRETVAAVERIIADAGARHPDVKLSQGRGEKNWTTIYAGPKTKKAETGDLTKETHAHHAGEGSGERQAQAKARAEEKSGEAKAASTIAGRSTATIAVPHHKEAVRAHFKAADAHQRLADSHEAKGYAATLRSERTGSKEDKVRSKENYRQADYHTGRVKYHEDRARTHQSIVERHDKADVGDLTKETHAHYAMASSKAKEASKAAGKIAEAVPPTQTETQR